MAANSSEYESLKASGGLDRIRDAEFRQRLTVNYERYPQLVDQHDRDCERMLVVLQHVADEVRIEVRDFTFDVTVLGLSFYLAPLPGGRSGAPKRGLANKRLL